ncbi:MAG: AbrB/MazE/SpoVT family DNA-binding domain-containing protein [Prosthecobacter sp.]
MTAIIQRWGSSLALRIPMALAREVCMKEGDVVTLEQGELGLMIKPSPKRFTLDDLLAKITPENLHAAVEWGPDSSATGGASNSPQG